MNYGKKKTIRNILIGVIAAVVVAAAIFLTVMLQKDGAGMNRFQSGATAVSGDGVSASVLEYRLTFDMLATNYQKTTLTDEQMKNLQEYAAQEVLMQKVYAKEAKALGLSLTDEQKETRDKTVNEQIDSVEQYYAQSLISGGNYSKAALDKQVQGYYQRLGMSKDAYRAFLAQQIDAEYFEQAISDYYAANGSDISEEDLVAYYRGIVEESMMKTNEDGTETVDYSDGQYWNSIMLYLYGYSSPMLFVPEGFIYIDFIELTAASTAEAEELVRKISVGETDFDELMNSDENKDMYRQFLKAPYPIAENDHSALFSEQEVYARAAALQIGEIGSYIVPPTVSETETDESNAGETETAEGTKEVTVYVFRRAEGDMCYEGDHGVIKIDYYDGMRASVENQYHMDHWLSDIRYSDAVYAYKGELE